MLFCLMNWGLIYELRKNLGKLRIKSNLGKYYDELAIYKES